jgi:hypothetical protein
MSEPEDTCRPVEVDGEIIRVHGSREMTEVEQGYFADIVRAAEARMEAEAAAKPPARCDDTELLVTECACKTCRPDLAKVEPAEKVKARVQFIARCDSPCDLCDGRILAGEWMGYAEGDARVCKRHLS